MLIMRIIFFLVALAISTVLKAQNDPKQTEWYTPIPPKVSPGEQHGGAPSDAIVLFDGKDLKAWESASGDELQWEIVDGELQVVPGSGNVKTKQYFGDCQLHIEFKSPDPENYNGQDRGNSGIFLQSRYEIQVLDADNNDTYVNGMVGSIYKQKAPLVNAYTKNGDWQVYDIYWKAPRFGMEDELLSPAVVTVVLNGVVVQNNQVLSGDTPYVGFPQYEPHGLLPLMLQDHGTAVRFRNIWIRSL